MYTQRALGELSFRDMCRRLERRYEGDFRTPAAAWKKLDEALQQQKESLILKLGMSGRKSIEPRLVSKFCLAAWDRDAGVKAMDQDPPKTLDEAVDSVRWYQHVQVAADNKHAERSHAKVQGWALVKEEMDNRYHYSNRRGDTGSRYDR